jgi:O-antigen/teichoic acid export membrane protein
MIFPLMCCLAAVSFPLIDWVLGEKWHFAAVLLIPICFQMMWYPIHSINLNLLQVKGRSDLFLRLEIIKKVIGVAILFCSLPFGLLTMCYSGVFSSLICLGINTYYTGKMINVGFLIQAKDISGTLLLSLAMFCIILCVTSLLSENVTKIIIGLFFGFAFFVANSFIFKMKELTYIKELIKK